MLHLKGTTMLLPWCELQAVLLHLSECYYEQPTQSSSTLAHGAACAHRFQSHPGAISELEPERNVPQGMVSSHMGAVGPPSVLFVQLGACWVLHSRSMTVALLLSWGELQAVLRHLWLGS